LVRDISIIPRISFISAELSTFFLQQGRKCTAYPAVKLNVVLAGATWLEPDPTSRCFTDGNLVTGAAWLWHPEFIA